VKRIALLTAVQLLTPAAAQAAPADTIHTIDRADVTAVGGSESTKFRFEGRHAGTTSVPYIFDLTVQKRGGTGPGGNLVFREIDAENFYQLDFRASEVVIRKKVSGRMTTEVRGCRGFGATGQRYGGSLYLKGNRFEFYEAGASTPCVAWTDTANHFPTGENASYYTMPGTDWRWVRVEARPMDIAANPLAWSFPDTAPGYLSPQPIHPTSQSIATSRWTYTVQNYRFGSGQNGGSSSTMDHVEHGADGHVEYHLDEWSAHGARLVYRATVGQYGYHLRLDSSGTRLGKKTTSSSFVQLGSAPAVPVDTHLMVKVDGSRHRVINEENGQALLDVTDSQYPKGNKTYWGATGTMDRLRGSFVPRP
jgi:hypothetical protein